jgi:hypothetical protein
VCWKRALTSRTSLGNEKILAKYVERVVRSFHELVYLFLELGDDCISFILHSLSVVYASSLPVKRVLLHFNNLPLIWCSVTHLPLKLLYLILQDLHLLILHLDLLLQLLQLILGHLFLVLFHACQAGMS